MTGEEIKKIAYIWEGLPYVFEEELSPCACGGRAVTAFHHNGKKFSSMEVYCKQCGITTGVCENEVVAINKWESCFEDLEQIREDAAAYLSEHWDDCLAWAGQCPYD